MLERIILSQIITEGHMGYIRRGYKKIRPGLRKARQILLWGTMGLLVSSVLLTLTLRWLPVYLTPLMLIRTAEYAWEGRWLPWQKQWVPLEEISPHLMKAVIASEDPKFLTHGGFDFEAISRALDANKRRKIKMGASTISQQTAKNVFLFPARTWFRKGLEAYFTVLIENLWDKRRILEVYLNVVELGEGVYGAEAAGRHYWNKTALRLNADEAQMLAAVLPNPRLWNPKRPTNFVLRRKNFIRRNLALLGNSYFSPLN
jgi:monofunctional biosynthetic peptidoglycan transglycosylase